MAAQRRMDLVLDSVRRLLRIGATANLLNLLQKQHPADLAQIFGELQDKEREAAFTVLADRNGRLAMEAVSELGPENGAALLATRPAEEIARLAQEIPSDDAAALIDYLPEELSAAGVTVNPRLLYAVNPMVGVIEGFRAAVLGDRPMPWDDLAVGTVSALLIAATGCVYFRSRERLFADVA